MPAYPPIKTSGDVDIVTQLPYTESDEFPVVTEELECGKGYALNWYTGPQPRLDKSGVMCRKCYNCGKLTPIKPPPKSEPS